MRLKKTVYILGICIISWATIVYFTFMNRLVTVSVPNEDINGQLVKLEESISEQFRLNNNIITKAQKFLEIKKNGRPSKQNEIKSSSDFKGTVIPVLVFACNRVSVSRCLDQLIQYRPNPDQFPIIVSQVSSVLEFKHIPWKIYKVFWHLHIIITSLSDNTLILSRLLVIKKIIFCCPLLVGDIYTIIFKQLFPYYLTFFSGFHSFFVFCN